MRKVIDGILEGPKYVEYVRSRNDFTCYWLTGSNPPIYVGACVLMVGLNYEDFEPAKVPAAA